MHRRLLRSKSSYFFTHVGRKEGGLLYFFLCYVFIFFLNKLAYGSFLLFMIFNHFAVWMGEGGEGVGLKVTSYFVFTYLLYYNECFIRPLHGVHSITANHQVVLITGRNNLFYMGQTKTKTSDSREVPK